MPDVRLGTAEAFPVPAAVYTCRCGRHAVQHGRDAACLPPGWEERSGGEVAVCPQCAERSAGSEAGAGQPAR